MSEVPAVAKRIHQGQGENQNLSFVMVSALPQGARCLRQLHYRCPLLLGKVLRETLEVSWARMSASVT